VVAADARLTYEQLDGAVDEAAAALYALGVSAGDVIVVSLPNESGVVVSFYAAMRLGAIWLGVNRSLAPPEKAFIIADAEARLVIADEAVAGGLHDAAAGGVVGAPLVVSGPGCEWQQRMASAGTRYPRASRGDDEPAGIAYTSGTTGRPKGVVHSHRNLLLPGAVLVEARGYDSTLRKGDCAALTILNLQVTSTLLSAQAGGTQVVMDRVDAEGIASWIQRERVTSWFGVPTMLHDLATSEAVAPQALATLDDVWSGGTYVPAGIRQRFEHRFGKRVHATYGLTEAPTVVTIEARGEAHVQGSSGRALPHLSIEIRDEDAVVVPAGCPGEITVRASDKGRWAGVYRPMLGYRGEKSATAAAVDDGVLHTGDVGEIDEGGNLFVHDRRSSIILRGGANVYPAEVERVLLQFPGVVGAAVVGFDDERLGQRVAAAIEVGQGPDVDADEVRAHCQRELARYKVPERWRVQQLPRNAMGKVVRTEVERWFGAPAAP
jgi:acyl-CoA synthetase (AMP-forming)/AMP-acid ligase II